MLPLSYRARKFLFFNTFSAFSTSSKLAFLFPASFPEHKNSVVEILSMALKHNQLLLMIFIFKSVTANDIISCVAFSSIPSIS